MATTTGRVGPPLIGTLVMELFVIEGEGVTEGEGTVIVIA
jgi:hypothetical protein